MSAAAAAARLVAAASADGGGPVVWLVAVLSFVGSLAAAVLAYKSNSKSARAEFASALQDDQRELIKELRADNAEQRQRLTDQGHELHQARLRIDVLEAALRRANIPLPDPYPDT